METKTWRKILQKQIYDVISHRYGLLVVLVGAILIVISAFHFGESVVEWSTEKYAAVFNSFSDNLAGKSFRERLCLPVPIDVVYTWVNGSDPDLIRSLQKLKLELKGELNTSRETKCVFSNCLPSNTLVLHPALPIHWNLAQLGEATPVFHSATKMYRVTSPIDSKNYTAIIFDEDEKISEALNKSVGVVAGRNTTIARCYITSDSKLANVIPLGDQIIMSGFPHTLSVEELKDKLPEKLQKGVEKIEINAERGLAVLHVPMKEDFDLILSTSNFTIEGKQPTLNAANLVWDLRDFSRDEDISSSRFEDNEELRYSLRSLEKFAPWIRNVYIVTNGQLPYWLNLENPRISIITHDQIFLNKSHLPSFGSPAIESNIHRIPGLSDKFIYMNDDVMFGKEVWPDDFFTHSQGQKVYLTWPVPNCNEGCPSSWIKDGYCDKACNVSECEWDAGDCNGSNVQSGHHGGGWAGHWNQDNQDYCHTGCANNWIADRYCDSACNSLECAFDAGDCGTDNFDKLHGIQLLSNISQYQFPKGLEYGYFNLTSILSDEDYAVKNAFYDDNKAVRTISVSRKFHILTVVLLPKQNSTTLNLTLVYGKDNHTFEHNFTLSVDTTPDKNTKAPAVATKVVAKGDNVTLATNTSRTNDTEKEKEEIVVFKEVPRELQQPMALIASPTPDVSQLLKNLPVSLNLSDVDLPPHLKQQYTDLQHDLEQGDLTDVGYKLRVKSLWIMFEKEKLLNQSKAQPNVDQMNDLRQEKLGQGEGNGAAEKRSVQVDKVIAGQGLDAMKPAADGEAKVKEVHRQRPDVAEKVEGQGHAEKPGEADDVKVKEAEGLRRRLLSIGVREARYDDEEEVEETFVESVDIQPENGKLLPWERNTNVRQMEQEKQSDAMQKYAVQEHRGRHLLDTFGDSLRHVNTLFNKAFGYTARKVPGHMPHMIDRLIMNELQDRFPAEWEATSSHQVRHSKDMQYAFSYFYYLTGVKKVTTAAHVFDDMDTDKSRVLSDREIRTLATRLYELPLDLATLTRLENMFANCSKHLPDSLQYQPDMGDAETYYEKEMPQVTRNLFIHCSAVDELVKKNFPPQSKYKHTIADDSEIAFKMIKTNVSTVVGQLDDIRKRPKKFICLNDNIDHGQDQASTVKAILQDFYESILPIQSQFELPREYRNRFTHIDELREWRRYRDWLKFWTHIALALLVIFTVASYFGDKIEAAQKRFMRRCHGDDDDAGSTNTSTIETV